jgi:hypothetical protein
MATVRLFGAFSKVTPQDDGTLVVEGIASSESVDSQGETVKADAMRAAIPDYMKFANVREMHQAIAAGKALAIGVDDAGVTHLTAHVVDPASCKKVAAGVLQGFSIGGHVPPGGRNEQDPNIIETINLTEISLVDRPANPDALITLVKMENTVAEPEKTEPPPPAVPPAEPAPAADVMKAGARFSKTTKAALASLHKMIDDCSKGFGALGYQDDGDGDTDGAGGDSKDEPKDKPAQKDDDVASAAQVGELQKRATEAEQATKAAGDALQKVMTERDALAKELAAAKAELAKKPLRAVPVSKAEDGGQVAKAEDPAPPENTPARVLYEIKKSYASGPRRLG